MYIYIYINKYIYIYIYCRIGIYRVTKISRKADFSVFCVFYSAIY